jgi:hypothetical protein
MKNSYKAYRNSNYFSRDDYPTEPVTIQEIREEQPGGRQKKLVAYCYGNDKGLILNQTNARVLAGMAHSDNPVKWGGLRIEIFDDPTVMYGSEVKGGLRVRPAPTPTPVLAEEEAVPF